MRKRVDGAALSREPRGDKRGKKEKKQLETATTLVALLTATRAAHRRLLALATRLDNAERLLVAAVSRSAGNSTAKGVSAPRAAKRSPAAAANRLPAPAPTGTPRAKRTARERTSRTNPPPN
jgi:hypothetical protein